MRVCIVSRILWRSGAVKLAIHQARALEAMGHQVELVFLRRGQEGAYDDLLSGLDWRIYDRNDHRFLSPLQAFLTHKFAPERGKESTMDLDLIASFGMEYRGSNSHWLVCHDQWTGIAGLIAKKLGHKRYTVFVHERVDAFHVILLSRVTDLAEKLVLAGADCVCTVTDPVRASIAQKYQVPSETNPFGMELLGSRPFNQKENLLLAVSMWDEGRRPWEYLKLLEGLQTYRLIIAGSWRTQGALVRFRSALASSPSRARVEVLPDLSEQELDELYYRSKFVVRLSFGEFGAGGTHEFVSHGTPMIVNRDLGSSKLIESYGAGLVIPSVDATAVREFVISNDNERSYAQLLTAVRNISADHTWPSHCKRLIPGLQIREPGSMESNT